MIVGGYTLDLYCDSPTCVAGEFGTANRGHFYGQVDSNCRQQARDAGWDLRLKENKAYCPSCSGLPRKRKQ